MIRSKDIVDYVEVPLSEVRADTPLPFDLHLYFPTNRHIMVWRKQGEALAREFIDKYLSRGVKKVLVHKDDSRLWEEFIHPAPPAPVEDLDIQRVKRKVGDLEYVAIQKRKKPGPLTEEGAVMTAALKSKEMAPDQKRAVLAEAARELAGRMAAPATAATQPAANARAAQAVEDLLDSIADQAEAQVTAMWRLARIEPQLEHAVTVSTYAVIFSLAFGHADESMIADVALAGLLHDIGLSQVPTHISTRPWSEHQGRDRTLYATHVNASLRLIDDLLPGVPERVKAIIRQHHEKFDGTGYPGGVRGFKVDDVAQVLALADVFEGVSSGRFDGKKRSLQETMKHIESLDKVRTFPEYFNPEVFSTVMRWMRKDSKSPKLKPVARSVRRAARKMMPKVARSA